MGRILPYSVKTAIKEMIENEKSINNTDFEFNEKLNEPKVSIILPIYNQANYLDEAIQGVLNQTYQKFELIIVNDGSTDNVEKIFDKYKEYKKVILLTQKNQKLPSALNNGFHFASGDYFTWTSADNIMLPNQIEKLVEYLNKNPDKGMVYSDYQAIDDKGKPLNDPNFRPHNQDRKDPSIIRLPDEVTELNFHDSGDNFIGASFMYRKEVAYVIGKYDTETFGGEDYDYWLRIHNLFSIGHIKDVLYRYRVHENTLNAKAKELRLFENIRKLLEKDKKRREFLKTTLEIVESESEKIETHKRNANIKVAIYKYSNIKKLSTIGADSNSLNLRICELDVDITDVDLQILDEYDLITTTDNKAYFYLCDKLKSKLIRIDSKKDRELFCKIVKNKVFDKMYVIQDMKDLPSPYRNRKVNLAIQVESMDKGGLEEVVCGIIRNISKEIFNVYLIVNDNKLGYLGEKIKEEGYNVVIIDNNRDLLLHTIKNNKIDIVNLHYSIFGIQEYKRNGIGIIYTIHNSYTWLSEQQIKQRKLAYKEVNHFIAVSNQVRDFFANKFNVRYSEIATISNGFDANEFKNVKGYNREHFGIAKDDFVFIDVASFNGNKFQNVIVSAMKELKKEFPSFKVILVGNTSDEKYYKFILRLIRKNGLKENIKIIDFKPKCELGSLLKAANCFILPSIQEGWSCAIMEAMYFELPLILSEIGSAKDVIRNKDIGIIIRNPYKSIYTLTMKEKNDLFYDEKPNNTKDLKGAMIDIYKNYKEWKVKSKKGKEKVLNEFNIKSMIKNYETEYTATNYIYKKVK
jgi:glycosyltransferase involved in cell wall biosynthesis